ncbi:MAG: Asp-tRNA(Asn)/Glu-tRNA(Gln) amidotransferase GatCAB subunit C [Acidiferrobacteraceae bacterium]|nr:Asp-tRNA(Asn)/Glu-tRNA(Gln) amidotransferase GatCAB subunit C [Acidiferrobacteraceae bacterium]|tara:strand:+ start:872 stop:1159 length:288 start_codon:yes stop_codon:yes gene_type:complete
MSITKYDVEHIANLARIRIDTADIEQYTLDLARILELFQQMDSMDVKDKEPLAHPQDIELRLRNDEVTEPEMRQKLQSVAPSIHQGLYSVPQIIE